MNEEEERRERMKVYIAAPYTPKNCSLHEASRVAHKNVKYAMNLASLVMRQGHYPILPHLSHYLFLNLDINVKPTYWYNLGIALLKDCDVLFTDKRIEKENDSFGVKMEVTYAKDHNIPVITDVNELPRIEREDTWDWVGTVKAEKVAGKLMSREEEPEFAFRWDRWRGVEKEEDSRVIDNLERGCRNCKYLDFHTYDEKETVLFCRKGWKTNLYNLRYCNRWKEEENDE